MAFDGHKNFSLSTVATAPSPASSGTSLVVAGGDGTKFPTAPFNAVIWPTGAKPSSANAEVVRVTVVSTDTFTITRAQEGSSARTVIVGDQIMAAATSKVFTDIEALFPTGSVVGTTDAQTVSGKVLSDEFMGDVWDNQGTLKQSVTLTASTDFLAVQSIDVSGAVGLEVPATSSLEISSFYDPSSVIPTPKLTNPYKFSAYRNAAQNTGNNAFAVLQCDTKAFDTGNNLDVVLNPGRFTAPIAGFYQFSAAAEASLSGAGAFGIALFKNGSRVLTGQFVSSTGFASTTDNSASVSGLVQLAAKDYVEAQVFGSVTIALVVGTSYSNYFNGFLVSTT